MKIKKTSILISLLMFSFISACDKDDTVPFDDSRPDTVVINEILSTGNPDWLELYNFGSETVDLAGFIIFDREDAKYTLPSGYSIDPGDFLVLFCNGEGRGLNLPFRLSAQGESVTLQRPDGKMLDHVLFPAMSNQQSYARFPDGPAGMWQITGFATQNQSNGSGPVSYYNSFTYLPAIPLVGDPILFTVEVSDGSEISNMEIRYAIDSGPYQSVSLNTSDQITYTGTVPAMTSDCDLQYYFRLVDNASRTVTLPGEAENKPYKMTITSGEVPLLFINEFMASNSKTFADPFGEYDDWIEIYNPGTEPVDLGRFYLSDKGDPFHHRISRNYPGQTTVPAGGFLIFWADGQTNQGPNHLRFKLSASGESISLYYKDGRLIDSRTFGPQSTDVSEGRTPDGGSSWVKFNTPTPGSSNQ